MKKLNNLLENKKIKYIVLVLIITLLALFEGVLTSERTHIFFDETATFLRSSQMFDSTDRIDFESIDTKLNRTFSGEEFTHTLSTTRETGFTSTSIVNLCEQLITNRQYNVLLNIISTIHNAGFDPFDSLLLNCILMWFLLLTMYFIGKELSDEPVVPFLLVILTGLSRGVLATYGYYRFYAFYVLMAMLLTLTFMKLIKFDYSVKREMLLIFATCLLTVFGYFNAEYMLVLTAFYILLYFIICLREKKYFNILRMLGVYVLGAAIVSIREFDYFVDQLANGSTENNTDVSQLRVAFDNLLGRPFSEFRVNLQNFVINIWAKTTKVEYLIWGAVIVATIVLIAKGSVDKESFRKKLRPILFIALGNILYILALSQVCPWSTWRYETQEYPCILVVLVGILCISPIKDNYKKIVSLLLVIINVAYVILAGNVVVKDLDDTAFCLNDRTYMEENYAGVNGIYFYDNDNGTAFYGMMLVPLESQVYVTTQDLFSEDTDEKDEILKNDEILVYLTYGQQDQWDDILSLLEDCGYSLKETVLDSDINYDRHIVYLMTR